MPLHSILQYGERPTPQNWRFEDAAFPYCRLYYVMGGSGYYRDARRELRFCREHLYLLPADTPYSMWDSPTDPMQHLYVHALCLPHFTDFLCRAVAEDPFLSDLLPLLRKYVRAQNDLAVEQLSQALIGYLCADLPPAEPRLARVADYLERHAASPLEPKALESVSGYSYPYLKRIFQAHYRVTPKQYHAQRRFAEACRRLGEGSSPSEVAARLGYTSVANFSRDFKKHYRLSPTEYVKCFYQKSDT